MYHYTGIDEYPFVRWVVEIERDRYSPIYKHDVELAFFQHTREATFALADSELMMGIVVSKRDGGILPLLIVVVRPFVLIEGKLSVSTWIDEYMDEIGRFLFAPLHLWTDWQNTTCTDEDRDAFVGGIDGEGLTSLDIFVAIEVVPATLWKIDLA